MDGSQPLPREWLMTDERQGERLFDALARLPAGAGIVFRHYSLPADERWRLYREVRLVARRAGLLLLLAGPAAAGKDVGRRRQPRRRPRRRAAGPRRRTASGKSAPPSAPAPR